MVMLEVCSSENEKQIFCSIPLNNTNATIGDVKHQISIKIKIPNNRLSLRMEPDGMDISDEMPVTIVGTCVPRVYVKDLGFQIDWKLSHLLEYIGPVVIYGIVFFMPQYIFDENYTRSHMYYLPFILWLSHFIKRILETLYVHIFSHATMSLKNLLRNCAYYWGFAALIAYHVNHPLYSPPFQSYQIVGTLIFIFCELGNFSAHLLLRNLRTQSGNKERMIPFPNSNPFTYLFKYVTCPNYTYEFGAWLGFSLVCNCFYTNLFTFVGFTQMTAWATAKHRRFLKEYEIYPKNRKIIIPFFV